MRCLRLLLVVPLFFGFTPLLPAQGPLPPKPFRLSPNALYLNPAMFRMDHVGGCAGNGLEQDVLKLQWQSAWYTDSLLNPRNDTIRYEVVFLVDSAQGTRREPIRFLADGNGADPSISIPGDEIYRRIFPPPFPPPAEPDTIVLRVKWYVRAWNSVGSTLSDTAGVSIPPTQQDIVPNAVILSYNRRPSQTPVLITPLNNAVLTKLHATSVPIDVIWTPMDDRNIIACFRIGGFRMFHWASHEWREFGYRAIDTLTYQWAGEVVRTSPPGKGAPIGTMLIRNTGTTTGFQISPSDLDLLFAGFSPPAAADTVVVDFRITGKDFLWTDGMSTMPVHEITFRYRADGTLYPDTALFSRFGCRPHEHVSPVYRFTFVRAPTVGIHDVDAAVRGFSLAQNYPNPFRPSTSISFTLAARMPVTLIVTDALGATVRTLADDEEAAGMHAIVWDGADDAGRAVPSGTYFARLSAAGGVRVRAMVLTR
jgi:hypothetical protein